MKKETIVIDFGGSILSPEPCRLNFRILKGFKKILLKYLRKYRFIVVVGGGKICRMYQNEARRGKITNKRSLDWIGIRLTQLNAELMRAYLGKIAFHRVMHYETQKINWDQGILVSGGWHPGASTDYITASLAGMHGAKKIVVATNINYVYNKDPRKYPDAKKQLKLTWKEFGKIIGKKWIPGMSTPFDHKASRICVKNRISVEFVNGSKLANLEKAIAGKPFRGSTISN